MQRCSGSNMVEPCSCGLYHHHQTNSFSMLFSMPYEADACPSAPSDSFSSVDCTLSLGTPSTRLSTTDHHERRRPSGTNFCWDLLKYAKHTAATATANKGSRGGGNSSDAVDPLRARRCANCDTTSTPLWRNGPRGPKSLCNACGIRFKKEERRATAAAAVTSGGTEGHHHHMMNGNTWVNHAQATHKLPSYYSPAAAENEFRFTDDVDDRDSTFLSWRLNVTDRPALVHDFTR